MITSRLDGFTARPQAHEKQRIHEAQRTAEHRLIVAPAGIKAIERGADELFDLQLSCLARKDCRRALERVMDQKRLNISYAEREHEKRRPAKIARVP